MKVYIYTIPKAGTYFLADFIARLGFNNTGMHINQKRFLNTAKLDMETNARFPSRAMERQPFMKTLREMNDLDLAFGHFPVPLMAWLFPDFFFVCAYRHPRKTLMAEFVDFRFRREDLKWMARDQIPDDRDAFCAYLERHGEGHMAVFSQMLALTLLRNEPLCGRFQTDQFHMLNFEDLLKNPQGAADLAARFGIGPEQAAEALDLTRNAETKTKATGLEIDREALWSDRAEDLYARINAEAYVTRGRELGWTI
ncbi:sulfotransferase domain-containing protein [Paracoccaceae bacterium Fryx2]|nr:sulfotransferase domain-containing protein [Paracoccaceae bacterium Fryx2]